MMLDRVSFLGSVASLFLAEESIVSLQPIFLFSGFDKNNIYNNVNSKNHYDDSSLIQASKLVRNTFKIKLQQDPTLAGPLIRLAFHDACTFERQEATSSSFTGGPNGSIQYEIESRNENRKLQRPLDIVIKVQQQSIQQYTNHDNYDSINHENNNFIISLADTIALGGAVAVEFAGGPFIPIRMGRQDAQTSDPIMLQKPMQKYTTRSLVTTTMPSPGLDSDGLRLYFKRLGLSEREFVALSGVHGLGRHVSLLEMSKSCLKNLTRDCLETAPVELPFVTSSVDQFDNSYFKALLQWNAQNITLGQVAFIPTDVALVVDSGLRQHVQVFANNKDLYFDYFTRGYQKLVDTTAMTKKMY